MLLDDLVSAIETLRQRISTHREILETNKTRTRMALIDPLLDILGWDPSDPSQVYPELDISEGQIDYVLRDSGGNSIVYIQAKKLGEPLEDHTERMVSYANTDGVRYAGLTNGNHWMFYEVFTPKPLAERQTLSISIKEDNPAHSALKLLWLWRSNLNVNLQDSQPVQAHEPLVHNQVKTEPDPISQDEDWISLEDFKVNPHDKPPAYIRFPGGQTYSVGKTWKSLLVKAVTLLLENSCIAPTDFPVTTEAGRGILLSKDLPMPRDIRNQRWTTVKGYWLCTHHSAMQIYSHLDYLVKKFGKGQTLYLSNKDTSFKVNGDDPNPVVSPNIRATTGDWTPIEDFRVNPYDKPPAYIRFAGGQTYSVGKTWKSLLVKTVTLLLENSCITPADCPILMEGGRGILLHHEPPPVSSKQRWTRVQGYWLYTNLTGAQICSHTSYLVKEFGRVQTVYVSNKSNPFKVREDVPNPVASSDTRTTVGDWISIEDFKVNPDDKPPAHIRFAGEQIHQVGKTWKSLLVKAVTLLLEDACITPADCPIYTAGESLLLRRDLPPVPADVRKQRWTLIQGYWLFTDLAPMQICKHIAYLIKEFGRGQALYVCGGSNPFRVSEDGPNPAVRPIGRTTVENWTPIETWTAIENFKIKPDVWVSPPGYIRSPQGRTYQIEETWKSLLVKVVTLLLESSCITLADFPISMETGKEPLLRKDPPPVPENVRKSSWTTVQGYWLYTSLTTAQICSHISYLIKKFGKGQTLYICDWLQPM